MPLAFAPGEAAQLDFGAGPKLLHPDGSLRRTWAFVMTLCFSRHQYVEFVWDQTVATWLSCHRRAFEWFTSVPRRLVIYNPKYAISKACIYDPVVQRSYTECTEGWGFRIDPCPPADASKKGSVEAGVKFVKMNYLRAARVPRLGRPQRTGLPLGLSPRERGKRCSHVHLGAPLGTIPA